MYDGLTATYRFSCPAMPGTTRVRLSSFRRLERVPGTAHPAIYGVAFACACGDEHDAFLSHADLDLAPVASAPAERFYNVMTGRLEEVGDEIAGQALARLSRGQWPWCFFCRHEGRPQPVFPSAIRLVTPGKRAVAVAARCAACGETSANVVSAEHLDVPFYSDAEVGVIEHELDEGMQAAEIAEVLAVGARTASRRRLAA